MQETGTYYYGVVDGKDGWIYQPPDDCGYREQADRIDDYESQHIPESVLPYVSDKTVEFGHPDGCSVCGRATWWESRELPNGQRQSRCSECRDTLVWPK